MDKQQIIEIMKEIGQMSADRNIQSYAVGGLVRDFIMNLPCDDLDITSDHIDILANAMEKNGGKIIEKNSERFMGKIIKYKGLKIDLVAPRKESYHPSSIKPIVKVGTFEDDVYRRDFTLNALYYDLHPDKFMKIIDLTKCGMEDLFDNILDTPLDPDTTFMDDPSRMLRAVRFEATRGFDICERVEVSIRKLGNEIHRVPKEIIHNEMLKGAISPTYFMVMDRVGLTDILFPEVTLNRGVYQHPDYHTEDAYTHILLTSRLIETENPLLRIASFFHDVAKADCEDEHGHAYGHIQKGLKITKIILRRYKYSNKEIDYIYRIIQYHHNFHNYIAMKKKSQNYEKSLRKFVTNHTLDFIMDIYKHSKADILSDNPNSKHYLKELNNMIDYILNVWKIVENEGGKNKLEITGNDIMELGWRGMDIGTIKNKLQTMVDEGTLLNKRDLLLEKLIGLRWL